MGKNPMLKSMLLVGGISLLVKALGFYKETIVASSFGLSELLDTYYIAILIPTIIQTVFIGSLKNLFIPNYITELITTKQTGNFQTFTLSLISLIVLILITSALIFSKFFLESVFPGHTESFYSLVRYQLYWVLPCLLFWGYTGFLNGLQEINNNYFASTISQVFLPIGIIVCLVFFKDSFGNLVLAIGMLVGSFGGFLFTLFTSLYKKIIVFGPLKINENMRIMLKQYPAKSISGLLTGINPFVDQFFAAQLVVGSIAALNYGIKIPAFVVGILILAVGNVLLPHFSRQINEDLNKAYLQLFKILKIIFIGSLIIVAFTIIFSNDIIRILFERKEFTAQDTFVVSNIQKIALVYVPFYLCTLVCVKFLTATNKNKFMAWTSFWNLLLNLTMNYILVKYYGVYGLMLATTIVYILASLIYVGYTYKQFKLHLTKNF
ncbi:polysaccharide biosynthesis C-terminal domain-containing protein [Flavobacteriaceae bacterium F89]|uniref:Polysaccharide biosynthesis C-terminal domain-containing protein n=2 Tax=Cerina litoralis TaxID=2874477 RepID=A0AAE3EY74_9FLAO|nr:polysaccharide biosynthesis C-terminal domain-containing protein [Cerina litoralis]